MYGPHAPVFHSETVFIVDFAGVVAEVFDLADFPSLISHFGALRLLVNFAEIVFDFFFDFGSALSAVPGLWFALWSGVVEFVE